MAERRIALVLESLQCLGVERLAAIASAVAVTVQSGQHLAAARGVEVMA